MRTTLRIDRDLMAALRERARRERVSLTRSVNRLLRRSLKPFRQKVFSMGKPTIDLDKALSLAAALEDRETLSKYSRGE